MVFESVRGYVELASGLTELTRARAMEAAQGLLSLPAAGIATSSKVAVQAGALADELMAAAAANRSNLRALVRSEVDIAVTRLGLVPAQKLQEARAEAARLRAEVSRLRSAPLKVAPTKSTAGKTEVSKSTAKKAEVSKGPAGKTEVSKSTAKKAEVSRSTAKKAAVSKSTAGKAAVRKSTPRKAAVRKSTAGKVAAPKTTASKSAVTTRAKPAGT